MEAWSRLLASAGLSPAIGKVLALEQGQTDRLCEPARAAAPGVRRSATRRC
jgi:hypothetical protein